MFSLRRHRNTGNEMNEPDAQLPPWDHRHESCQAERRCTHWINFPSRESSFSSLCSRSSSLACLLRMFSLSSSRHFAFSIISCRFRSNSSDESFLLNTKTILSGLLLFQQKKKQQKTTTSGRTDIRQDLRFSSAHCSFRGYAQPSAKFSTSFLPS